MTGPLLTQVKQMLSGPGLDTSFDPDLLMHINSSVQTLIDLGVTMKTGFTGVTAESTLDDVLSVESAVVKEYVLSYIYMKTKMAFDPPPSANTSEAFNKQISELEFRILVRLSPPLVEEVPVDDEL